MGVSVIDAEGCRHLVDGLSKLIDFEKALPANMFFGDELGFWFFERPLFDFLDSFSGLIRVDLLSSNSDVLIKFSGCDLISSSCFSLGDSDIESDVLSIQEGFRDFLVGGSAIR